MIRINNYKNGDILRIPLPLLVGEITVPGNSEIILCNLTYSPVSVTWPVVNGKFKALVRLAVGENKIQLCHKGKHVNFNLIYEPLKCRRFIRLVYIKCVDDVGLFQAPADEDNSVSSACKRIALGAQMLQTFTYDKLAEHNLKRKTFHLEEKNGEVICHVFTSSLSLCDAYKLNEEQLWSHFAVELMNSNLRVGNDCKFLAFLSFTRYHNNSAVLPQNHREVLQMTKGQVALGGGGLAIFGSGCLHTWPENLQEVPWRFGDKRRIDKMKFMDDSANRGWHWACYSTGLGSTLHELGHTFDLGHTKDGIMGRGFDDIYKYFIVDMFYCSHPFHKQYNPYYQESSIHRQTVSFTATSSVSWEETIKSPSQNFHNNSSDTVLVPPETMKTDDPDLNEKPWKIPNPPEKYCDDPDRAVHVGRAYWTRSSALILYYHKWFNDVLSQDKTEVTLNDTELSSPNGVQVVEYRDIEGMSFHHLEFPEGIGPVHLDLSSFIIPHIPEGAEEILLIAEDKQGYMLKVKLNVSKLQQKQN